MANFRLKIFKKKKTFSDVTTFDEKCTWRAILTHWCKRGRLFTYDAWHDDWSRTKQIDRLRRWTSSLFFPSISFSIFRREEKKKGKFGDFYLVVSRKNVFESDKKSSEEFSLLNVDNVVWRKWKSSNFIRTRTHDVKLKSAAFSYYSSKVETNEKINSGTRK